MFRDITNTLYRDLYSLTHRYTFWLLLALWAPVCAFIFFAYIEDFLAIQPTLRAKNVPYGVTDLVIIPYIKTLGTVAILLNTSLCSRLFFNEHFSDFSNFFRSIRPDAVRLIVSKILYIILISTTILLFIALPIFISIFFFEYNTTRVIVTLFSQLVLSSSVCLLALVLSQILRHSILVTLTTGTIILISELAVRLIIEPTWLASIMSFFSPLAHTNRIAMGVISLSDLIFFAVLWSMLIALSIRQFNNTYLTSL